MSSRKKIVAGNWKMNTSYEEAIRLVRDIQNETLAPEVIKIFFPPFPFIFPVFETLTEENFYCGAQNCSQYEKGAYTGEVSAAILASIGAKFVIVGHSERRTYFKESNGELVAKIQQCLKHDLHAIFCFGEILEQRKDGKYFETVKEQLSILKNFSAAEMKSIVLAYEPVWAIGTGETATPQQAQEMHAFIRKELSQLFDQDTAAITSILYGGSCNAQNAKDLFGCADVDGGLIGGASLKAKDFCTIINSF